MDNICYKFCLFFLFTLFSPYGFLTLTSLNLNLLRISTIATLQIVVK